jgi:hypothetical protein
MLKETTDSHIPTPHIEGTYIPLEAYQSQTVSSISHERKIYVTD